MDLLCLATLVYLADTRISRVVHSQNSWTREIEIELPVANPDRWNQHRHILMEMLNYLSGDRWSILFVQRDNHIVSRVDGEQHSSHFSAAMLFSGGMDSLINVINHLEKHHKVILVSHAGDSNTKNVQENLLSDFKTQYPDEIQPLFCDLWMVFDKDIIPNGGIETTTRSRSFLFIAFGCCVLSGIESICQLEVPENGLIALNVPLDLLRVGSHSTHTTHPFYLGLWNSALSSLGFNLSIANPYWNMTKGEMAEQCTNQTFLLNVLSHSISCSSMTKSRWTGNSPQHCGHCVPCIIRRAATHKAFKIQNENTIYTNSDMRSLIQHHSAGEGVQLRSFQMAIYRLKQHPELAKFLIHKSGKLANDGEYLQQLSEVYYRGLMEVDQFIEDNITDNS